MNDLCPISKNSVDSNETRIVAFFVVVLVCTSVYFSNYLISGLLAIDFAIRAFSNSNLSPLRLAAMGIRKLFRIKGKRINAAPKKFAAGMGMVFCCLIAVLQWMDFTLASQLVGIALIFCALLECAFGFCVGCKIYSLLHRFVHD